MQGLMCVMHTPPLTLFRCLCYGVIALVSCTVSFVQLIHVCHQQYDVPRPLHPIMQRVTAVYTDSEMVHGCC